MKYLIKIAFLVPMIALLASCAEPRNQVLTLNNKNEIKNTKAILNTTQSGIRLQENDAFFSKLSNSYDPMDSGYIVHQNTASGGSLLVDAIYTGVQNHDINEDKKAISPMRKTLGDFNYLDYFKNDLNKNLSQLHWLNLKKTEKNHHITTDDEKKLVNTSKENTTLFIGSTYALSENFRRLGVAAYVKLDEKATKTQPMKTLYKRRFFYVYYLNFPENNIEKNKQA